MQRRRVYIIAALLIAFSALGLGVLLYKSSGSSSPSAPAGGSGSSGAVGQPVLMVATVAAAAPRVEARSERPTTRARPLSTRTSEPAPTVQAAAQEPALPDEPTGAGPMSIDEQPTFAGSGGGWGSGTPTSAPVEGGGGAPMASALSFQTFGGGGSVISSPSPAPTIDTRNGIPRTSVQVPTSPVDEPNLVWLMLAGLGALSFKARRNK